MRILPVKTNDNYSLSSVNFGRKPRPAEYKHYVPAIKEGLKVLNKELGFIIHNQSAPSSSKINTGIGSLLTRNIKENFIPFLIGNGFSTIQQEPNFIRRLTCPSPYDPLSTSKNIYMIPIEKLATEEYGFLLNQKDLKAISTKNDEKVNYKSVHKNYNNVLGIAYNNWRTLNYDKVKQKELSDDYIDFRTKHWKELEPNAMYEVLAKIHKEEDWTKWPDKHKYLYDNPEYQPEKEKILQNHIYEIDFHMFKQWLTEREIEKTNNENGKLGIKIIADTPIAFTPTEVWMNKDLFLENLVLGCPPDYFSKDGQRWGFAFLDPHKIFNKDGSLGKGGEFLKKRYESIFATSPGGVRIDHLIGLIDPFVYTKNEPMTETNSGRIYTSPHKAIFKDYGKYTDADFTAIFDKIIFPAAEKYGITKDKIICEDLGDVPDKVKMVIQKLNLTGLTLTQFGYSGYDAPPRNVILIGAHDNQSFIEYTNEMFNMASQGAGRDRFMHKTHILGSDTVIPGKDVNQYREEIRRDKKTFMAASVAELFTSPARKVQIFFTDFFGIGKTYNVPGTKKDCWTLRLQSNYEDLYYENLKNGTAINLPQAIATAIRQKGTEFSSQHTKLLRKLDYFTKIFKD